MSHLDSLFNLIESEIEASEALVAALEGERRCLESRDLSELQQLLYKKAELLGDIENLRERRSAVLNSLGILDTANKSSDKTDKAIRRYFESLDQVPGGKGIQLLDRLRESLKNCMNYNELNGLFIANSQKRNQRRLDIMRGISSEQQLYDARGKATRSTGTHSSKIA